MAAISGKSEAELDQLSENQQQQLKATADLFPDALVESELGKIPEGWVVNKVGDIVDRLKPKKRLTKKQVLPTGTVPVFEQGADILLGYHDGQPGFSATPENPLFIFGDHTCVVHLSCSDFDISQNVIPLAGKGYPTLWVYYAIQDKQVFQEYRRHWAEFVVKDVVVPSMKLTEIYSALVTGLCEIKEQLAKEGEVLREIRETLLPKLLSGELPRSEAS